MASEITEGESLYMGILDYFDRLAIVHLPDRDDRLRALTKELSRIGIDIDSPKVTIPDPPMPKTSNGFTFARSLRKFSESP